RQVGRLRLARPAREWQRPCGCAQRVRSGPLSLGAEAACNPLRHSDGQGRALSRVPREEPLHQGRPARVAAGAANSRSVPTLHATRRSTRMNTATEKKPPLTTWAMSASIAGEGQRVKAAPFGKALVALAE